MSDGYYPKLYSVQPPKLDRDGVGDASYCGEQPDAHVRHQVKLLERRVAELAVDVERWRNDAALREQQLRVEEKAYRLLSDRLVEVEGQRNAAQAEATEWRARANAPFVLKDTPIEAGAAVAVYPGMTFKLKTTLGPEAAVAGGGFHVWPPVAAPEVSGGNFDVMPPGSAAELERLRTALAKADDYAIALQRCCESAERALRGQGFKLADADKLAAPHHAGMLISAAAERGDAVDLELERLRREVKKADFHLDEFGTSHTGKSLSESVNEAMTTLRKRLAEEDARCSKMRRRITSACLTLSSIARAATSGDNLEALLGLAQKQADQMRRRGLDLEDRPKLDRLDGVMKSLDDRGQFPTVPSAGATDPLVAEAKAAGGKTIDEIRAAFRHMHHYAIRKTGRPYMQIPANPRQDADLILSAAIDELERLREPISMVLPCPKCGRLHVDAPEPATGWANPPHKSHLCLFCKCVWRPADVPTNGVERVETRGKADTWPEPSTQGGGPR